MSRTYAFRTLDVFTSQPYKGNQLGIVTIPASQPLTQEEKQAIAIEFNYSETIFVHSNDDDDDDNNNNNNKPSDAEPPTVKVDIFTPESELPFAGHPTVGAVNHILTHVYPGRDVVNVSLKAGVVVGKLDRSTGLASAEIPQEFHQHGKSVDWEEGVVPVQAGFVDDQGLKGSRHVVVSVVRGMNFALVDLTQGGKGLLDRVKVTKDNVATGEGLDDGWPSTVFGDVFFAQRPDQGDGVVRIDQRVIVIGLEDSATGSASCALTIYLALKMGGKGAVHRFEIVQGEKMGRRSVITTEVTLDESGTAPKKVMLMGQCKAVMKGELEI